MSGSSEPRGSFEIEDGRETAKYTDATSIDPRANRFRLQNYIPRYCFLNTNFSINRWPDSNVPVVDTVICCPSGETTHRSV